MQIVIPAYPKVYLYRRIVQAKIFIDHHFAERIDLKLIAGEAYFSKFHFIRLFKLAYGKTPHQYLVWVRMEQAKLLLQADTLVAEVCFAVGFDSVSSFTSLFKRINSVTPGSYRELQLKRKQEMRLKPLKFVPNCFAEKNGWIKNSNFQEAE